MTAALHQRIIVATDLDGTLLDHYSYSWQAAKESLAYLAERKIPIVINTSKTFAEVVQLQEELAIDAAFIVENGSAIYVSENSALAEHFEHFDSQFKRKVFGLERSQIVSTLQSLRSEHGFKFEGYADWQVEDVIAHTGLSEQNAKLSLTRQFSEPLVWQDSEANFDLFSQHIEQAELRLIRGGRFIHTLGQVNKGKSLTELQSILYPDEACSLICLGDSHNDLDMLNIADIPVFVRSPVHDFPPHKCKNTPIFTEGFGPNGWREAMHIIFND